MLALYNSEKAVLQRYSAKKQRIFFAMPQKFRELLSI